MSKIHKLLSLSTSDYNKLNVAVRMYNPLYGKRDNAIIAFKGIGIPLSDEYKFGGNFPSKFKNDVKHQIKKDGTERIEVTSHLLITDTNETLHYDLPYRKRNFKGNAKVSTVDVAHMLVPSNVHTVIQLINVFKRELNYMEGVYVSSDVDVTIFSRDATVLAARG